ncbi:MAG: MBL fold metallo-hydrolase [Candidatus Thorarchaeota archaeon]
MNRLKEIDRLEVTIIMDNVIDFTSAGDRSNVFNPTQWVIPRHPDLNKLAANHGFSALVKTESDDETHCILYDVGSSGSSLTYNLNILGIDTTEIEAIVISHGHWDHFGGLLSTLRLMNKGTPIYLHHDMFSKRGFAYTENDKEKIREMEQLPSVERIREHGGSPVIVTSPTLIANNYLMISGEVPRQTDYEKGLKGHRALVNGEWIHDETVKDDRSLIANVREVGLVVMSGCSHAGIVNIVENAKQLVSNEQVHAIIGGLHLIGKDGPERTAATIADIKRINPSLIVPCHCTGWKAQHAFAREMPNAYACSSVGNKYVFTSGPT